MKRSIEAGSFADNLGQGKRMKQGAFMFGVPANNRLTRCEASKLFPNITLSPEEQSFLSLLDLSSVDLKSPAVVIARFDILAKALLHGWRMVCHDTKNGSQEEYEILEIEFYLNGDGHADPFTHAAEEQRTSGQW
jgi:hypothetical protein